MKTLDSMYQKQLTITIGSNSMKPELRDFDADPLSHEDISNENEDDKDVNVDTNDTEK